MLDLFKPAGRQCLAVISGVKYVERIVYLKNYLSGYSTFALGAIG